MEWLSGDREALVIIAAVVAAAVAGRVVTQSSGSGAPGGSQRAVRHRLPARYTEPARQQGTLERFR
jgi:hypothetical protein